MPRHTSMSSGDMVAQSSLPDLTMMYLYKLYRSTFQGRIGLATLQSFTLSLVRHCCGSTNPLHWEPAQDCCSWTCLSNENAQVGPGTTLLLSDVGWLPGYCSDVVAVAACSASSNHDHGAAPTSSRGKHSNNNDDNNTTQQQCKTGFQRCSKGPADAAQDKRFQHQSSHSQDHSSLEQHAQHQHQQLELITQQLAAGEAVPADELLPLLTTTAQMPQAARAQLLPVLTNAAVASLPQLLPQQLAAVLEALQRCQQHSAATGALTTAAGQQWHLQDLQQPQQPVQQQEQAGVENKHVGAVSSLSKAVNAYLKQQQQQMDPGSTAAVAAALAAHRQHSTFTIISMLVMDQLPLMSPEQLVQLLGAFAAAEHYNQAVCEAVARFAVQQLSQQGFRLRPSKAAAAAAAEQGIVAQQTIGTQQQQQQLLVPGEGSDSRTQQQQQQQQTQDAAGFTGAQLGQLLQSISSLRHHDAKLLEASCTTVLRSRGRSLQEVVDVVQACAVLNHYNLPLFEEAVRMAQQALAESLHHHHNHHQQQQQQRQLAHQVQWVSEPPASSGGQRRAPLSNGSLSTSQGSSRNNNGSCRSPAWLSRLMAGLAWSCGVVQHWDSAFLQQLSAWSNQLDAAAMSREELLQWYEVQTSLTDAALSSPSLQPLSLNSSLLVAAQAALASRPQSRRQIAFQKEVVEAMRLAGVRCRLNVALDGPVSVDVALQQRQVGQRYRVALQLDPSEAFAANSPHAALGPTAARWRALQVRGWQVVSLRQSDWRRLKTQQQRLEWCWQLGQGVEVGMPGMPHIVQVVVPEEDAARKPKIGLTKQLWRMLLEGR